VTPGPSFARKAIAAAVLAIALFAAVVIQLTVVNRLPLPGAATPDLVLLLVSAIAVATSPLSGAVTGFAGGLALDVAPPAAHYAGEYALVFCLVGYAAARVNSAIINMNGGERDPIAAFTVMATAAAAGEAGKAALGMLLSDPDVTGAVAARVLPGAILYDLLLAPLAFWLVSRVTRAAAGWNTVPERAHALEFSRGQRVASVFRQASAGAVPRLRLAGTGETYGKQSPARRVPRLRLAGTGETYRKQSPARRDPKLRLSGARSGSSFRTTAAFSGSTPFHLTAGRTRKLSFAGDLRIRTVGRAARTPGKNWLRGAASSAVPEAKRPSRGPARGWLRPSGGAFAGARSVGAASGPSRGFMGAARSAVSPIAARPARSPAEALAARSAPSGLSALSGPGTPLVGRRSPHAGWLRSSRTAASALSGQRLSPRSGWLGSASRPRTVIGSGVGAGGWRKRRRRNWYAASPSGAWLRRSRHPWRKRSRRLLRMVGVGR
jgi:rod shape-determining protein MreD